MVGSIITPFQAALMTPDIMRPSLAFNFLTGLLDPRITFTRSESVSTRFNESGLLELVGANQPRFDYDPVTLACRGLLIEEQRTNLVLQSENFGTTWTALAGTTPTRSAAAKSRGILDLDLLGDDSALLAEGYEQVISFTGNAQKSVSLHVSKGTATSSVVRLRDSTALADRLLAAITWSGTVPTVTMTTGTEEASPEHIGGDIYRIKLVTTSVTAANTNTLCIYPATDAALSVGATGDIYAGGVQAENAPFASSYIPTTSAQVTRTEDIPLVTGLSLPAAYSIYVSFRTATLASPPNFPGVLRLDDGTNQNRIGVYSVAAGTDRMSVFSRIAGVDNLQMSPLGALTVGARQRIAARLQTNNGAASHNGAAVVTDTTGGLPAVNQMRIGAGDSQWNGWIEEVRIYPAPLTDAQLQALTA